MDRNPPNPYREASLDELSKRAMELAGVLLKGGRVGRRDVAYLLIAAAHRLDPCRHNIGSPRFLVDERQETIPGAFWPVYEQKAASARSEVLVQAVDAAGLHPTAINDYLNAGMGDGATSSDAKLRAALEDLDRRRRG